MNAPLLPNQESAEGLEQRLRSLLLEGRIRDAQELFAAAGPSALVDPKLRAALSPPIVRKSNVRGVDRSAEFRWLDTHSAEYQGKWVALVGENLVASSDTLEALLARLRELQLKEKPLIDHLI